MSLFSLGFIFVAFCGVTVVGEESRAELELCPQSKSLATSNAQRFVKFYDDREKRSAIVMGCSAISTIAFYWLDGSEPPCLPNFIHKLNEPANFGEVYDVAILFCHKFSGNQLYQPEAIEARAPIGFFFSLYSQDIVKYVPYDAPIHQFFASTRHFTVTTFGKGATPSFLTRAFIAPHPLVGGTGRVFLFVALTLQNSISKLSSENSVVGSTGGDVNYDGAILGEEVAVGFQHLKQSKDGAVASASLEYPSGLLAVSQPSAILLYVAEHATSTLRRVRNIDLEGRTNGAFVETVLRNSPITWISRLALARQQSDYVALVATSVMAPGVFLITDDLRNSTVVIVNWLPLKNVVHASPLTNGSVLLATNGSLFLSCCLESIKNSFFPSTTQTLPSSGTLIRLTHLLHGFHNPTPIQATKT